MIASILNGRETQKKKKNTLLGLLKALFPIHNRLNFRIIFSVVNYFTTKFTSLFYFYSLAMQITLKLLPFADNHALYFLTVSSLTCPCALYTPKQFIQFFSSESAIFICIVKGIFVDNNSWQVFQSFQNHFAVHV